MELFMFLSLDPQVFLRWFLTETLLPLKDLRKLLLMIIYSIFVKCNGSRPCWSCAMLLHIHIWPLGYSLGPRNFVIEQNLDCQEGSCHWNKTHQSPGTEKKYVKSMMLLKKDSLQYLFLIKKACAEIFRKRHALNKFMPPSMLETRKSTIRQSYANFGKQSVNRASIARKSAAVRKNWIRPSISKFLYVSFQLFIFQ